MNLGVPEIILILVVALLFFGPSRLPSLGKSVGEAIRGFKKGLAGPNESEQEKLKSSNQASSSDSFTESKTKKKESEEV